MSAIDVHQYLGRCLFGYGTTPGQILRDMDSLGIERAVLCPVKPPRYRLESENRRVAMAVLNHPERFACVARVDPWQGLKAIEAFLEAVETMGARGLFLHPWEENFQVNASMVDPLVLHAIRLKVPVMIVGGHVRVSTAWQIADLARRHTEATFIATSGGQINISGAALEEAEVMLEECPNVLMETSGIYREDFIEDMAGRFGSERILFGSGSPVYDVRLEIARGQWAHLAEEDRANILYRNALRVFWGQ